MDSVRELIAVTIKLEAAAVRDEVGVTLVRVRKDARCLSNLRDLLGVLDLRRRLLLLLESLLLESLLLLLPVFDVHLLLNHAELGHVR